MSWVTASSMPVLQGVLTEVTDARNREMLFAANEDFIIKVQALGRGYITRKRFKDRREYLHNQEPAVVKIQVAVAMDCSPTVIHYQLLHYIVNFDPID